MGDIPAAILPAAVALYLVIINIVAVVITIRDKKIAIANGKLEDKGSKTKSGSKSKKTGKSSSKSAGKKTAGKSAVQTKRRVPEKTLLIIAALGGSIAMLITMRTIRHKTQHMKFMVGIPAIIVLQCALVVALVVLL